MSAEAESKLTGALLRAVAARRAVEAAEKTAREHTVAFTDEALNSHWSWEKIGTALGVSGAAARQHYKRNRGRVRDGRP